MRVKISVQYANLLPGEYDRTDDERIIRQSIRDQIEDKALEYNIDTQVFCRTHGVDRHGWGYRRELIWGESLGER